MRIDGPQITGSLSLNGDGLQDLDALVTTSSLNTYTSSVDTTMGHVMTATHSLNTYTSSANSRLNSVEGVTGSYATTGSNLFKGNQTISGSIIPAVDNTYDLGSTTHQFRDLYLSSASLYIDGTKVLSSTTQELQITTDTGQSFKILEAGSDTITLQSADGNITLATSGGGDVILDPTTGVVALKGTTQVYAGNKVRSSDGNNIVFGDGLTVSGSVTITGFIEAQELRTTYISSSILYRSGSTKFGDELDDTHSFTGSLLVSGTISVPGSGLISGSSQILNGSGVFSGSAQLPSGIVSGSAQTIANLPSGTVSGSVQVDVMSTTNIARLATTGSNTFNGNQIVSGSFKVSGSIESSYDGLATEGGQLILRGPVNRYNVDNWSGNALRIFREDDATAANGNVIIFASGSGQVGINKNATNATLDVNGNTLVSGSLTATNMNVFGTTELAYINGTTQMRISRSGAVARLQNYENGSASNITLNWEGGNLGVGVTDPSTALDVYKIGSGGALTGAAMTLRSGNASDTSGSQQILFSYSGGTLYRHSIRTRHMSDAAAGNAFDFYTWKYGTDTSSTIGTQHVMTIDGNARVGIQSTTPEAPLHIGGSTNYITFCNNIGAAAHTDIRLKATNKGEGVIWKASDTYTSYGGAGALNIYNSSDLIAFHPSNTSNVAVIASTGIGIGNTNPKFYLHSNDDVTIPNNRYLNFTTEINAANFNKSLVVSYTDNSATSQPNQIGLILHNNSNTDNTFSPALVFGSKSTSNVYSQATAAIAGKRLSLQQDANWHGGELYFWTATSGGASINQGIPADAPAMILDSRRRMRVPSQPSFQVHRGSSANFEITNSSDTNVLPFNTVRHDTAGNYNTSTYRFTAPIAGRYFFSATVRWDSSSAGSYLRTFFTVNGSSGQGGSSFNYGHQIKGPSGYSSNYQSLTVSAVIQLAAGDYVSVVGGINSGTTNMHQESQFSGYMLG